MPDKEKMEKRYLAIMKKLIRLTNDFLEKHQEIVRPKNFKDDHNEFLNFALCAPSMITASVVRKLAQIFPNLTQEEIINFYMEHVKKAIEIKDYSEKMENE